MPKSYEYSGNVYDSSAAGTTTFALTSTEGNAIRYLQRSHIHVYKSTGEQQPWTELSRPADWDFNTEGTEAVLSAGITAGEWIRVLRITPYADRYVDFQEGSLLTASQLDEGEDFSIFVDQELSDEVGQIVENLGIPEAPDNGTQYGRQSKAWTAIPDIIPEAPDNGTQYGRQSEAWTEIPASVPPAPSDGKTYGQKNGNWSEAANEAALDGKTYGRKDGGWVDVGTIGDYVTEAPDDGIQYGRQSEGWTAIAATLPDAPQDGNPYGRKDASWVRIDDGTGGLVYRGTINVVADPPPPAVAGDLYINTGVGNAGGLWTGIAGDAVIGNERVSFTASNEWVSFGAGQVDQDLQSVLETGHISTLGATFGEQVTVNAPLLVNRYIALKQGTGSAGGTEININAEDGEVTLYDTSPIGGTPKTVLWRLEKDGGATFTDSVTIGNSQGSSESFAVITDSEFLGKAPSGSPSAYSIELGANTGYPNAPLYYTKTRIKSDGTGAVAGEWMFCLGNSLDGGIYDTMNNLNQTSVDGSSIYIKDEISIYTPTPPSAHPIAYEQKDFTTGEVLYSWFISRQGTCRFENYDLESLPSLP